MNRPRALFASGAFLAASSLVAGAAPAADEASAASLEAPNERRAGVVIGMSGGLGFGGSSGYPNSASKIDDPSYYSESDLMFGSGGSFFLMGALTDYLNFGLWFGGGTFDSSHWHSTGGAGGFRLEVFPLYRLYPALSDLALFTQLGVGATTLHTKLPGNFPDADGAQSFLGLGAFYEWKLARVLGGHLAGGPSVEYDVIAARAIERHGALLGGRIVFYGGI